jgi:NAD(P)-dependent dehydrogenase (short-subunit alcohol dehydrogenase family)
MACDITDKAQLKSLAEEIGKKEPHGMNLLVNNAGVAVEDSTKGKQPDDFGSVDKVYSWLWNADQSEWDETLKINVTAQYFATAAFIPLLAKGAETKSGHSPSVVNITSVAGVLKNMMQGQFAYAASCVSSPCICASNASV